MKRHISALAAVAAISAIGIADTASAGTVAPTTQSTHTQYLVIHGDHLALDVTRVASPSGVTLTATGIRAQTSSVGPLTFAGGSKAVYVDAFPVTKTADAGTCDNIATHLNNAIAHTKWDLNWGATEDELEADADDIENFENLAADAGCAVIYD
jgi:hypothetical protein